MVDVFKQQLLELMELLRGEFMYSETSDRVLSSYHFYLAMDVRCPSIRWMLLDAAKTNALSKVTHASIITAALRSTCNTKTSTTHLQWVRAMNYSMGMLNQRQGDFTETLANVCLERATRPTYKSSHCTSWHSWSFSGESSFSARCHNEWRLYSIFTWLLMFVVMQFVECF